MKTTKLLLVLFLSLSCGLVWAQTNTPAGKPVEQELNISSDSFYFDGVTNQMVYLGHVFVNDNAKAKLHCEKLTVYLPADRSNPTNIVAETNVVVDVLDEKGETNHVTSDMAVYSYQLLNPATNMVNGVVNVVYAATNEIITFTGGNPMPKLRTSSGYILADPLIIDVVKKRFETPGHVEMHFKQLTGPGTNSSPFELLK